MRLQVTQGPLAGWTGGAEITTAHVASREGMPVLVVEDRPVPILEAAEAGYRVVEASDDERRALQQGGYCLPDLTPPPQPDSASTPASIGA